MPLRLLCVVVSCTTACDSEPAAPAGEGPPYTYAQHIEPILAARCVACHEQGGIGGFPLADYDDVDVWAEFASLVVADGLMPPFPPTADGCPPIDDARAMPAAERDMLLQWVADGRPLGDPDSPPEYSVSLPSSSLGEPTHRFPLADEYYAPVEVFEEYRCFRIDPEITAPTRFVGLHADTTAPERFHVARVSILPSDRLDEVEALEAQDGRPGWPCYYNPGVDGLEPVGGWLPGRPFELLPDGTAVELEPGTQLVVDAYLHHYAYEPLDLSVVGWESSATPTRSPSILAASDDSFVIPAGTQSHSVTVEADVVARGSDLSARPPDAPPAVHEGPIWSVEVHMHQWGRSAKVEIVHQDGTRGCLLHIPSWDVEWQGSYALAQAAPTGAGDRIVATCEWANGLEDQPLVNGVRISPTDVTWGLDERHEMCEVRLLVTPE